VRLDSQDVGLEAAIIERVRNSSLVECACTDNVTRLKHRTEAVDPVLPARGGKRERAAWSRSEQDGRGALRAAGKPDREDWWSARKCECRNE
jgi:hypothetical protein